MLWSLILFPLQLSEFQAEHIDRRVVSHEFRVAQHYCALIVDGFIIILFIIIIIHLLQYLLLLLLLLLVIIIIVIIIL